MKLKQLLSPEVLGWIEKHEHLEGAELFNEYEKWFFKNEEKINESVNNNLEKINEYIEKGKKRAQPLLESEDDDDIDFGDTEVTPKNP